MHDYLTQHSPGFFELTAGTTIALAIRYTLTCGFAWLLAYVIFKQRWLHRKTIARLPQSSDVWREVRYSVLSVLIFGMVGAATAQHL